MVYAISMTNVQQGLQIQVGFTIWQQESTDTQEICEFQPEAHSLDTEANVTFDHGNMPEFTFAFVFSGLQVVP